MRDDSGRIVRYNGIVMDISERKNVEKQYQRTSLELNSIINSTSDLIWSVSDDFKLITANKSFFESTHLYSEKPLGIGESVLPEDVYTEEQLRFWRSLYQSVLDGETVLQEVYTPAMGTFPGSWYEITLNPIKEGTKIIGIACFGKDISERKTVEASLRESERKYKLLHENAAIGIGIYSPEGIVISYNNLAAEYMGGVPEDFIGKSIHDLFPKTEAQLYHERIERAVVSDRPTVYEDMVPLPSGSMYFLSTFTKISDINNRLIGIQILSQDITERKNLEQLKEVLSSRINLAMEAGNIAWWEMDVSTGAISFADRKAKMLGYEVGMFEHYSDFMRLVHPDDSGKAMKSMRDHLTGCAAKYEAEYRILSKEGQYFWFYDVGSATKWDANGKPTYGCRNRDRNHFSQKRGTQNKRSSCRDGTPSSGNESPNQEQLEYDLQFAFAPGESSKESETASATRGSSFPCSGHSGIVCVAYKVLGSGNYSYSGLFPETH